MEKSCIGYFGACDWLFAWWGWNDGLLWIFSGQSYVYASGKYSHVAIIGLGTTLSRFLLYFLLFPMGAIGIAIAYALGELVSLGLILPSTKLLDYHPDWKIYAKIIVIPGIVSALIMFFNIPWFFGIPLLIVISFLSYTRLQILTKEDLSIIAHAFLSKENIAKMYVYARPFLKIMYGE